MRFPPFYSVPGEGEGEGGALPGHPPSPKSVCQHGDNLLGAGKAVHPKMLVMEI